jgi:Eukaryotic aspartyl protease
MPSYTIALVFTLLISSVLAIPAPVPSSQRKGRSFKVERVRNANFGGHDGTAAIIKAKRKWGMEVSSELVKSHALAKRHVIQDGASEINAALLGALGLSGGGGPGDKAVGDNTPAKGVVTVTLTHTHHPHATSTGATATGAVFSNSSGSDANGTGVGEVTATPEAEDVEFLSPVQIGGQTLNMDFDSGSSDLWVFNTQLPQSAQKGHTIFDPTKSPTFQLMQGATFSISYGDGSGAAGNVGTDTVNIGGATVTSQAVELATAVSNSFVQDTQSNGLVGLAFSKLNTVQPVQQKTFFANAIPTLAEPVFTADLKAGTTGAYEFGAIDTTKFNGSLSWAPINTTSGFWQFSSTKFSINNGAQMTEDGGQAIADTGTTLMLVNPAVVNAYYSTVNGAVNNKTVGGVTFPCSATLPDLQVDIGGNYMANVPGHIINLAKVDAAGTSKSIS